MSRGQRVLISLHIFMNYRLKIKATVCVCGLSSLYWEYFMRFSVFRSYGKLVYKLTLRRQAPEIHLLGLKNPAC